ncbi:dna-mediated transposase, partial [Lasius niger]
MEVDPNLCLPDIGNSVKTCNLDCIVKYGCDGASDQGRYNQKLPGVNSTDETVFTVFMVPLCLKKRNKSTIVWNNPHSASPRRCIPITLIFAKETKDRTKQEMQIIKKQIEKLQPTKLTISDITFIVHVNMHLTMVDGKVCQALSDTPSSASCYICGAKPSEMNHLERVKEKRDNICHFQFGLSTLHAWIRFMECILHIGYRLDFCKRSAVTDEQKRMKNETKERICTAFREELGLLIDMPNQGTGNTNNGNTARRFFSDPDLTSKITGVNVELIKRFGQILRILASSTKIPRGFFERFAFETAKLYVRFYPWFFMPPIIRKVLLHGGKIMQHFLLPIGQYSEEATEARNKDFKRFREFHTRKYSRQAANQDLIHKLLVSSDLYIASLRQQWKKPEDERDHEIAQCYASRCERMKIRDRCRMRSWGPGIV